MACAVRLVASAVLVVAAASGCNLVRGPPRESECHGNLRTIIAGELGLKEATGAFSVHPADVGFAPAPGNRYLYLFARDGAVTRRDDRPSPPLAEAIGVGPDTRSRKVTAEWLRERLPQDVAAQLGLEGDCPSCELTVACVGNIDDDDTVDVWSISTKDRALGGQTVTRGLPYRHVNDRER
jgi:hypothetical protein